MGAYEYSHITNELTVSTAMLILWRAMRHGAGGSVAAAASDSLATTTRQGALRDAGRRGGRGSNWPCSRDDVYCVVEEWAFV